MNIYFVHIMNTQVSGASIISRKLDALAISISLLCAIHCMITPLVLVLLPILGTSFWVHKDFHLWMLGLVLPTSCTAIILGCRKHKDRAVALLGFIGLTLILGVALYEALFHSTLAPEHGCCSHCTQRYFGEFNISTWINLIGAGFLSSGHIRNFLLCRKANCCH